MAKSLVGEIVTAIVMMTCLAVLVAVAMGPSTAMAPFFVLTEGMVLITRALADVIGFVVESVFFLLFLYVLITVVKTYVEGKQYPVNAFGERYIETERETKVEMCINCNQDGDGVEVIGRRVLVVAGFPAWTYDSVAVEECAQCADADAIDYALRRGEAPSIVEVLYGDESGDVETAEGVEAVDIDSGREYRCRHCGRTEFHEEDGPEGLWCPACGFEMKRRVRTHRDRDSLGMKLFQKAVRELE